MRSTFAKEIVQQEIETERLILRPFEHSDAVKVSDLAGDPQIYQTTQAIPHPYEVAMAERWIASLPQQFATGAGITFAIQRKEDNALVGSVALIITAEHRKGNIGYWIGVPYWGNGYCSEAAEAVVRFGFEKLSLHKIYAGHMESNPASGRVMQKIGMRKQGEFVDDVLKDGVFHTKIFYAIINSEPAAVGNE